MKMVASLLVMILVPASAAIADTQEIVSCTWNPSADMFWHIQLDAATQQITNFDGHLMCGDHYMYNDKLFDPAMGDVMQTVKFNEQEIIFKWYQHYEPYCLMVNNGMNMKGVLNRMNGTLMVYKESPPNRWSPAIQAPLPCKVVTRPKF